MSLEATRAAAAEGAGEKWRGADALVDALVAAGVSHVFGIPGEHCLGVVDAIEKHDDLRFVSVRHESNAAFMAEAFAKLTGRPGACLGTASVGATNLMPGINVAQHDSTPVVAVVGQVATGLRGRDAWQEVDLVGLFAPLSKFVVEVTAATRLPEIAMRAASLAHVGRPGPVMLSCPVDVQDEEIPRVAVEHVPSVRAPAVAQEDLDEIVEMLRVAQRPLVVVGGGIRASGAREDLVQLAEDLNLPVVTAFRRADAFPNDADQYIGGLGLAASAEVSEAVLSADLLVVIGTRLSELTTQRYAFPAARQRVIHIDVDPSTLASQWSPTAATPVVADARHAIRALAAECRRRAVRGPGTWWRCHRDGQPARARAAKPGTFEHLVREVAARVDRVLPDDGVVTSDAGDFFLGCAPMISFHGQRRYLGPTSGTMGYGLPAAIAAKMADPDKACVALCGDGGLMMSVQELETAARYRAAVVTVVFNNNAYGSIVRHQTQRYGGALVGTELGNPRFDQLAELFGWEGHRVAGAEAFEDAFAQALVSDRPSVIEVAQDL